MEFCLTTSSMAVNIVCNLLIFVVGTYVLIKGSDLFVDAAAAIARAWNVSEMVIGLTLVSIGTSLPELSTSLLAQINHDSDFVIGNIAGSNVTNITLLLGATVAFCGALTFSPKLLSRDSILMNAIFLVSCLMFFLCPKIDGMYNLNRICGAVLVAGAVCYSWFLFKTPGGGGDEEENQKDTSSAKPLYVQFLLLVAGLAMIILGSKGMVEPVEWGAEAIGVSTIIISATIVAFGTSVPELAVTIVGVLKKKADMAIGNIIGSCIFNILLIFGICALFSPLKITSGKVGIINLLLMLPAGILLTIAMWLGRKKHTLSRFEGIVLFLLYCAFAAFNIWCGFRHI